VQGKIYTAQNAIKLINRQVNVDWDEGERRYTNSVVAFLDICGIGKFLSDKNKGFDIHKEPYKKLDAELRKWNSPEVQKALSGLYGGFTINVSILSDSIVLSMDLSIHQAFSKMVMLIGAFYRALLELETPFFMRGAITVGEIYHTKEIMFGPALADAHEMEENYADTFRCIIRPKHLDMFRQLSDMDRDIIEHYFIKDTDEYYFFDYAMRILDDAENNASKGYGVCRYKSLILRMKSTINNELHTRPKLDCYNKCNFFKRAKCKFKIATSVTKKQPLQKGKSCVLLKYAQMNIYLKGALKWALARLDGEFEWLKEFKEELGL